MIETHWILAAVTLLPIVSYNQIISHATIKRFWDLAPNTNVGVRMVGTGTGGIGKGTGAI